MPKVCLMTCSGLTSPIGTILRQAVYQVVEDLRPEQTVLGCLPATNANVQEDIDFITNHFTIAVEGCADACVTKVMAKKESYPTIILNAQELLERSGFILDAESPAELSSMGKQAAGYVALTLARMVDLLLEGTQNVLPH